MKNIISFSLYGSNPIYQEGAIENIALAHQLYPEWTCRLYISQEIPSPVIDVLERKGAEVVRMQRRHKEDGKFWRFLPASENDLNLLIVRDTDSRINEREVQAVNAWIASSKNFHIMRDHPHHTTLILAGMWGCKGHMLHRMRRLILTWDLLNKATGERSFTNWNDDQAFLHYMVYPRVQHDAMIHSDLISFEGEQVTPFPNQRCGLEYVGEPYRCEEERSKLAQMLMQARPQVYPLPEHRFTSRLKFNIKFRLKTTVNSLLSHYHGML